MSSLYIHIPFCNSKCLYCDFYSVIYDAAVAADYVDVLCEQIERLDKQYSTIYIGGGTPTALGGVLLGKLLNSLKRFAGCATEFSLEANPESLSREILRLFLGSGVNRLSLGVQSFNDNKLNNLGRIHSAQAAQEAVHLARSAGFENIGIDLIFGVGNERLDGWRQELKKAAELPIRHISCYGLTYEKDTPLFNAVKKGALVPLEDEAAAEMYRYAIGYLEKEGFKQYEVSNFAQEGYACRHNQNYWENNAYLGLGASAVSYLDGVRKENVFTAAQQHALFDCFSFPRISRLPVNPDSWMVPEALLDQLYSLIGTAVIHDDDLPSVGLRVQKTQDVLQAFTYARLLIESRNNQRYINGMVHITD